MKQGYGIIHELESGISFLMQERGIHSMHELIGIAQPHPVTDFMALTPVKKISDADPALCVSCGNCARCPYLAITLDDQGYPAHRPGSLHRLLDLRQEMLRRRHQHADAQRRRTCYAERALIQERNAMATRFENGIVVTLGEKNRVLWNATVVTDGERVAAVGDAAEMKRRFPTATSVDCTGKIVLPGFICTHHHFYSTMARGMGIPGEPASNFVEILERLWWKVDRALDEEDITLSAQLPLIDCIRNGTTTVIDHHASPGDAGGLARPDREGRPPGGSARFAVLRSFRPQRSRRRDRRKRALHQEGRQG